MKCLDTNTVQAQIGALLLPPTPTPPPPPVCEKDVDGKVFSHSRVDLYCTLLQLPLFPQHCRTLSVDIGELPPAEHTLYCVRAIEGC